MPCKIFLRHDQVISLRQKYSSDKVTVFAPLWVKQSLLILRKHLNGLTFNLHQSQDDNHTGRRSASGPLESFTLSDFGKVPQESLLTLQKLARNEPNNVTGKIDLTLYNDIEDPRVLYSLRDLVRQTVICGTDKCNMYGGYRTTRHRQTGQRVYICDIAALQFQQPYNSGRLVLITQNEKYKGILDDFIYEQVVGEKKLAFDEVKAALSSQSVDESIKARYLPHVAIQNEPCFFDVNAYSKFVKSDVLLCGKALCTMVKRHYPKDKLCFKFLKYGTGFFAGKFSSQLEQLILPAALDGLEELFKISEAREIIKCVELPFYDCDLESDKRVEKVCLLWMMP